MRKILALLLFASWSVFCKAVEVPACNEKFEKDGWYWGNAQVWFSVKAGDKPSDGNVRTFLVMYRRKKYGLPVGPGDEFLVEFETGARSPIDLKKMRAKRPADDGGIAIYSSVSTTGLNKVDVYFSHSSYVQSPVFAQGGTLSSQELKIRLWGVDRHVADFIGEADMRKGAFPVAFSGRDGRGQTMWSKVFLLKTEGVIDDFRGNRFGPDVVITASGHFYMSPGGNSFYLLVDGNSSVKYSQLVQKINFATGNPVKNNPRLIPAELSDFLDVIKKVENSIESHYECANSDVLGECQFTARPDDATNSYAWSGYVDEDVVGLLDHEIKKRWFSK